MAFQEPVAGWPLPSHAPWEVIEGQGEAAEHTVLPGHPGWGQGVHFATALGRPCQVALTGFAEGAGRSQGWYVGWVSGCYGLNFRGKFTRMKSARDHYNSAPTTPPSWPWGGGP